MSKRLLFLALSASLAGLLSLVLDARPARAINLPSGFEDRLVTDVEVPTAMAFTPDGRMLIATQSGRLRVHEEGTSGTAPALDISNKVCSNSERGLLGVAVDPNFASNGYVYLYYTYKRSGACPYQEPRSNDNPVNRVSRFVMKGDNVVGSSEKVLITNIPSPNGNHNAGDLRFGKDGYLYVSVGDGSCDYDDPERCGPQNGVSRELNGLNGKILRITRDGGIPTTNPYATGADSVRCNFRGHVPAGKRCKEIFARGLRNPFRMAFDPDAAGTSFRINDVGSGSWEEVDVGRRGADYGWNVCEGRHDNPSRAGSSNCGAGPLTAPIHEYNHASGCSSITGAAFVPNNSNWPAYYDKAYLYGDYVCGKIFKLLPRAAGGFKRTTFATGLGPGGPVAMTFGPSGSGKALYYATYTGGGQIRRVSFADGNAAPSAAASANPPHAEAPGDLTIDFDGSGSRDPEGGALTYEWSFGDGTTGTGTRPQHTYASPGKRTVTLAVKDGGGKQSTDTVEVFPGDTPPEPKIESPTPEKLFKVGEEITLRGSAADAEDGPLADAALSWKVIRHHNDSHTHPYAYGTGNDQIFRAPAPEELSATGSGNYLEIQLTAEDSQGLKKTVTQRLDPNRVPLRLATEPYNHRLRANGRLFLAPKTVLSWEGHVVGVYAPPQTDRRGREWVFRYWSDRRSARHNITTPAEGKTYTAAFRRR